MDGNDGDEHCDMVKGEHDDSISNYINTISRAMLLCDDEPSPESSDDVFFICEEQTNIKCDDKKDSNDKNNKCNNKMGISLDQSSVIKLDNDEMKQKKIGKIMTRKRNKKSIDSVSNCGDIDSDSDDDNRNITRKSIGLDTNNDDTKTGHTIVVNIQVENCSQCPDNSISLFSNDKKSNINNEKNQCKLKKKTVAVQVNFNSIESVVESHCVKISKVRCCNKATRLQSMNKGKKFNSEFIDNDTGNQQTESTKIYLWNGKNFKNQTTNVTTTSAADTVTPITNDRPKLYDKSNSVDRATFKSKKSSTNAVSPHKKFNRSSLTIGPDKITINPNHRCCNIPPPFPNLSKYSPCASRLAASSKILGNTSPTALSPDSPLHVSRPKSPRIGDPSLLNSNSNPMEKMALQASLSLNIQQLKKSHLTTPRSRSVGDSCVTSPTSEATTLSYSPTGTEILSLDEVGQQTPITTNNVSLSTPDLKAFHNDKLTTPIDIRKANLETKC